MKLLRRRYCAITLLSIVSLLFAASPAVAADASSPPGFGELGDGASLSYLVTGELDQLDAPVVRLVVERVSLATGDALDHLDETQLISVESGNLAMTDDLGLAASLAAGEQLFAAADAYPEISADEPTTLLRARLTAPENDITIDDDSCTPSTVSAAIQDGLTIGNTTTRDQSIAIGEIGFSTTVPAGATVLVPIATIPDGKWQASCGAGSNGTALDEIAITVTSGVQPEATPTPDNGTTLIFANEITLPTADATTFFMADLALAADGSLGKQTFAGTTVISANDQPLWFKRPRRLTSTLADGASTVIPAGTQVTIENAGKEPATVLLVGIAPVAPENANATDSSTSNAGPTDRPVTRDEDDTAAIQTRYVPMDIVASNAGFHQQSVTTITSIDDSALNALRTESFIGEWERGVRVVYDPVEDGAFAFAVVNIDQFASDDAAAAAFDTLSGGALSLADETISLPPSSHIPPEAMIGVAFGKPGDLIFGQIVVRDGNTLISLVLFGSDLESSKTHVLALWQLYNLQMGG